MCNEAIVSLEEIIPTFYNGINWSLFHGILLTL